MFVVGARSSSPHHRHEVTFDDWLAASLVLDEIDRVAAGDVLSVHDMQRVAGHILTIVRSVSSASALCAHLPF